MPAIETKRGAMKEKVSKLLIPLTHMLYCRKADFHTLDERQCLSPVKLCVDNAKHWRSICIVIGGWSLEPCCRNHYFVQLLCMSAWGSFVIKFLLFFITFYIPEGLNESIPIQNCSKPIRLLAYCTSKLFELGRWRRKSSLVSALNLSILVLVWKYYESIANNRCCFQPWPWLGTCSTTLRRTHGF